MTTEEALVKFSDIWNIAEIGKTIEEVIDNVDDLMAAPAAPSIDTGTALPGGLLLHTLMVYHFAVKLRTMLSSVYEVDSKSLAKVCVLYQLGKVGMFTPYNGNYPKNKAYDFIETGYVLKTGERSHLICSNKGIHFTPEEREAMTISDKSAEEYGKSEPFISPLSRILRLSNDLAFSVERERWRNGKNSE